MTAESRISYATEAERYVPASELFELAVAHISELIALNRRPEIIVLALEAFIMTRNPSITIVTTPDSIAMMVGNKLKRVYYSELAN